MKKIVMCLSVAAVLGGALFAQEAKWHQNQILKVNNANNAAATSQDAGQALIGFEGGYDRLWNGDYGYNTANYGVKLGYIFNDNRAYIAYNRNSDMKDTLLGVDVKTTLQKVILGFETAYPLADSVSLIAGANVGYARLEAKSSLLKATDSGLAVGVKIGGLYNINNNNEIEFGFKAGGHFFDETVWNAGAYVGYNLKF